MKFLEKFFIFAGSAFGFGETLAWAYIFYLQSISSNFRVCIQSLGFRDWFMDVSVIAIALLFTAQALVISLYELFRCEGKEVIK